MPRLSPIPWQKLECVLLLCGFTFSHQKGSHRIYTKPGCIRPLVVPNHTKDLAVSVILSNLRTAGIERDEYFKLLEQC